MDKNSDIPTSYGFFRGSLFRADSPDAPWLVFLHGFPDDSSIWAHQMESLKNDYHVWAPDIFDHSFTQQVKGISEALPGLTKGAKVFLVAHDMGGPLACELARLAPDLFSGLLLINTLSLHQFISRWKRPQQWIRSVYMPLFIGPLHYTGLWNKLARNFLNNAYDLGGIDKLDPVRENSPEVLEGIKRYREIALELPKHLLLSKEKLHVETHIFFGMNDPFLLPPQEDELKNHFDRFTVEVIPTGHWPMRTTPDEVTQWIKKVTGNG